jgi:hypothetical protein
MGKGTGQVWKRYGTGTEQVWSRYGTGTKTLFGFCKFGIAN